MMVWVKVADIPEEWKDGGPVAFAKSDLSVCWRFSSDPIDIEWADIAMRITK